MTFTIFTNGTLADADEVNNNYNAVFKIQGELLANNVSATNSQILAGSSLKLVDKFLDSTGQNNTVDTGNTTGEYRTAKYYACAGSSSIAEASFETVSSWTYSETDANFTGARDSGWASKGTYSYKFTNGGSAISANAYAQILQSTDVTSWNSISLDYNITAISNAGEMTLQIIFGSTVIASTELTVSSGTLIGDCSAINGTQNVIIKILAGADDGSSNSMVCYVDNLTTQYTDSIVQSVATTIPSGQTKICCVPLMYEALSGSDNITFDVCLNPIATYSIATYGGSSEIVTASYGYTILANTNRYLVSVTKQTGSSPPTTARLRNSAGTDIATATFSGDIATFASAQLLTAGTVYQVVIDSEGSNYSAIAVSIPTLNFADFNIISYNALYSTIAGLTFSNNSAEAIQTGISKNTMTALTNTASGVAYIKMNLDTDDGTTTPKISGWSVLLE